MSLWCSNLWWKLEANRVDFSHSPSLNPVEFLIDWLSLVPMASFWADYTDRILPFLPHSLYRSPSPSPSDSLYIHPICPCFIEEMRDASVCQGKKRANSCCRAKIALILYLHVHVEALDESMHQRWMKKNFHQASLNVELLCLFIVASVTRVAAFSILKAP